MLGLQGEQENENGNENGFGDRSFSLAVRVAACAPRIFRFGSGESVCVDPYVGFKRSF